MGACNCASETIEHQITTEPFGDDTITRDLARAGLIQVLRDDDGQINEDYFLKLLAFTDKTGKKATQQIVRVAREDRRKHFAAEEWDEYQACLAEADQMLQ